MMGDVANPLTNSSSGEVPEVDVRDPQWQVSQSHAPDNGGTWSFPPERDGWVLAHNALRGEVEEFEDALVRLVALDLPLPAWAAESAREWWRYHHHHIHSHHTNEDELLNAFLRTRFHYPPKMEADHTVIVGMLNELDALIGHLREGSPPADLRAVHAQWLTYKTTLFPHLIEEERVGLPLLRAYFAPDEIAPVIQKIVKRSTAEEMGSFIRFQGKKQFREQFMVDNKIPGFVWHVQFNGQLKAYTNNVGRHIDALRRGVPPDPVTSGCCLVS
jgi:hypothetical protein